ncbi:DUF4136 domain-containing protein [Spirosoma daeguense]
MKTLQQCWSGKAPVWAILLLTIGSVLTACRDNAINDLSPADSPVYITNYDRSVNFGQYKTFSLPDSVLIESNEGYATAQNAVSDRLVNNVATALTSRGFQRVNKGEKADLGVAVILVNNQYTGVASNPYGYYSNYWGYGGLGGWGMPYYPSYYTYQVTDRYWEVQMVDLKNSSATTSGQQQLTVIYSATIRGSEITDTQSADAATTSIFSQSPYLQATR